MSIQFGIVEVFIREPDSLLTKERIKHFEK